MWVLLGCPGPALGSLGVALCAAGAGLGSSPGAAGLFRGSPGPGLPLLAAMLRAAPAGPALGPRRVPRAVRSLFWDVRSPAYRGALGPFRATHEANCASFGGIYGMSLRDAPIPALGSHRLALTPGASRPPPPGRSPTALSPTAAAPPCPPPRPRPRRRCPRSPSAARGGAAPPRNDVSLPGRGPRLPRRLRPSLPGEAAAAWPGPAGRRGRGGGGCCC